MDQEISIGIIYRNRANWIGGTYYIQNIISSLLTVEGIKLPRIVVFVNKHEDFIELSNVTNYPKLEEVILNIHAVKFCRFINRIYRFFTGDLTGLVTVFRKNKYGLKFIYPISPYNIKKNRGNLMWIPDFQEIHMPHLFSEKEIQERDTVTKLYVRRELPIVFSSNDAYNDFKKYYKPKNNKTFILPFTVTHPDFSNENINDIKSKYNIKGDFLFCANQFWAHKNHKYLFQSFLEVKKKGLNLQLVCSGRLYDHRNKNYGEELLNFIKENNLEEDIILVGFISRTEQLCLMANAYAIVQPSLFEGWNTTVEDAKCLNKFIFLSNLNVHIEQAPTNVCYFDPHDVNDLVDKLLTVKPTTIPHDYNEDRRKSGMAFYNIIKNY